MVGHTLKILRHLLQDFQNVSDHFGILRIKMLKAVKHSSEGSSPNYISNTKRI